MIIMKLYIDFLKSGLTGKTYYSSGILSGITTCSKFWIKYEKYS